MKIITTDASQTGWGAHLNGMTVHGLWTMDLIDPLPHINVLELKTILLALCSFLTIICGHDVSIMSDNTTAILYINCQGGTVSCSLCKFAMELWDFCLVNISWV